MLKSILPVIVFLSLIFTSIGINSQQQDVKQKKTPEERADNISAMMQKKLELTDEQKQSVRDVLIETFEQGEIDRELYKDDKEARRDAAKTRFEKLDSRFKEILSPEQYKKFEAVKQKKLEQRKKKIRNRQRNKDMDKG